MANTAVLVRLTANGAYAKWDPVSCREFNGADSPGSEERLPHFVLVLLFGASRTKVERFLHERYDTSDGLPDSTFPARVGRRLYSVGSDSIPAGILAIILNGNANHPKGQLWIGGANPDVTWNQFRPFIRNKVLNQTEEQAGTTIGDLA